MGYLITYTYLFLEVDNYNQNSKAVLYFSLDKDNKGGNFGQYTYERDNSWVKQKIAKMETG